MSKALMVAVTLISVSVICARSTIAFGQSMLSRTGAGPADNTSFESICRGRFPSIDPTAECDPNRSETKKCNELMKVKGVPYLVPTTAWQQCNATIVDCRAKASKDNQKSSAERAKCEVQARRNEIDLKNSERDKEKAEKFAKRCQSNPKLAGCPK